MIHTPTRPGADPVDTGPRPQGAPESAPTVGLGIAAGLITVSCGHIYSVARDAGATAWEAGIIAAAVGADRDGTCPRPLSPRMV
ncbi:hypothetical protein ACWFMI_01690 [Nocardiopsis terrae]